jgi:hypothetical protein
VKFDQQIVNELQDAISAPLTRGSMVRKIIDDPKLSNAEKAAQLGTLGVGGPGGAAGAIVIGILL